MKIVKSKILGCGVNLPKQIIKSDHLFESIQSDVKYGIPTSWMSQDMGIIERRMADTDSTPSDLAIPAAQEAIDNANINPDLIDLVIFCGIERDHPEPSTAHTIQDRLGLKANHAFDVANACFGFIDGMNIASRFIESKNAKYALVVTGEVPTKLLRSSSEKLKAGVDIKMAKKIIGALSVGDAGGAVILGESETDSGFEVFNVNSDSTHRNKCVYKQREDGSMEGQMEMAKISAVMCKKHKDLVSDTMTKLGWSDFDWVLSHQVGKRPFDKISTLKGVTLSKMIKTYDVLGNITSATFPVSFYNLSKAGIVKNNDRIGGFFAGSGIVIGQFGYTF